MLWKNRNSFGLKFYYLNLIIFKAIPINNVISTSDRINVNRSHAKRYRVVEIFNGAKNHTIFALSQFALDFLMKSATGI